jgi:phosphoribosylamine-glycine ligase
MNVLLLGGGGREHALAWKLAQSPMPHEALCRAGQSGHSRSMPNWSTSRRPIIARHRFLHPPFDRASS